MAKAEAVGYESTTRRICGYRAALSDPVVDRGSLPAGLRRRRSSSRSQSSGRRRLVWPVWRCQHPDGTEYLPLAVASWLSRSAHSFLAALFAERRRQANPALAEREGPLAGGSNGRGSHDVSAIRFTRGTHFEASLVLLGAPSRSDLGRPCRHRETGQAR